MFTKSKEKTRTRALLASIPIVMMLAATSAFSQVIQNTAAYGAESLAAATFNINPNYQMISEVGLTK